MLHLPSSTTQSGVLASRAGAIFLAALILYGLVAFCYILLYVPMTIGKPIRIILYLVKLLVLMGFRVLKALAGKILPGRRTKRTSSRRERLLAALAILGILSQKTDACQHINILEHKATTCSNDGTHEACHITLTELLKINTFHREACIRITHNATLIANIKLRWKGLYLHCERYTSYFTRSTVLTSIDSKRCPTMGSCQDLKCAGINSSSPIPELEPGNNSPGRTACMESCGGPGCDCFFLSSGCLFYRIYAKPRNEKIYELFRCARWTEEIKLEVTTVSLRSTTGNRRYVLALIPNVPTTVSDMRITMTAISMPPSNQNGFMGNFQKP